MIPDDAVEAAATAYQSIVEGNGQPSWDDLPKQRQDNRLHWMRAALEAAAPHMFAEAKAVALEEAADNWSDWDALEAPEDWLRSRANTYRSRT